MAGVDGVMGNGEFHACDLQGGGINEDAAFALLLQEAAVSPLGCINGGEADDVRILRAVGPDPLQGVTHAGFLIEGDDGEGAFEHTAEDAGSAQFLRGCGATVDGFDFARLVERH